MRSDLSFENIAAVLAALGASALVACGGGSPQPVNASEVAPSTAAPATGNASCSAKGCGASPSGAAAATSPTTNAASTTTDTPTATPAATDTPPAATTTPPATTAAPATTTASKTPPRKQPARGATAQKPKPKASGEASCGAGTCAADPKQKIL